jgi:hypothetical protein
MSGEQITVAASRETWLSVAYAVYAAYWEGMADPADALPILEALGIAVNPAGSDVLPRELDEFEQRRIAALQRQRGR